MKVEIVLDEKYQETYVKIFTDKYNKEIENLEKSLVNINNNVILGFKDDDAFVLDLKNIYRFFTEDKDVFIECRDNTYKSRLRMYEIEHRLNNSFVRISRSEIINISYIKKLDLSFKGTIAVELKICILRSFCNISFYFFQYMDFNFFI